MALDLEPAARRMATTVLRVGDDQLGAPTPCERYSVGDLLDHIASLTVAFALAARKDGLGPGGSPPPGDAANLDPAWRTTIPADLDALVAAWREPGALEGMTQAGGIDMPGEIAVTVALEELVVHGWDLATATGQPYTVADPELDVVQGFVGQFAHDAEMRGDAYGAPVPTDGASRLEEAIALTGRDPAWSAP